MNYEKILEKIPDSISFLGRRKYSESVVFVPFVTIGSIEYILFQVRAKNIRQGGEISFPGGKIEDSDPSLQATAIRETVEELGIDEDLVFVDGQFDSLVNPLGMIVRVMIGRLNINSLTQLQINKDEVEDVFLIPVKWFVENPPEVYNLKMKIVSREIDEKGNEKIYFPAQKLGVPKKYWNSWGNSLHNVYAYKFEEKIIWGITAEIIKELFS